MPTNPKQNPEGHSPKWWRRHPQAAAQHVHKVPVASTPIRRTLAERSLAFAESAILWGGIGVLVGGIGALLSLHILFVLSGLIMCVAVVKAGFFAYCTTWIKVGGNVAACLLVAVLLVVLWLHTPKPSVPPTLDQEANAIVDRWGQTYPWLKAPPKEGSASKSSRVLHESSMEFSRMELQYDSGTGELFTSNHPINVVVGFKPTTPMPPHDVYADAMLDLVPMPGDTAAINTSREKMNQAKQQEEKHFKAFHKKWLADFYLGEGNDQSREQIKPRTTAPLTWDDVRDLATKRKALYVFGAIKWRDDTGTYETDLCSFYEGLDGIENGVRKVVWAKCYSGHSGVRRPFDPTKD